MDKNNAAAPVGSVGDDAEFIRLRNNYVTSLDPRPAITQKEQDDCRLSWRAFVAYIDALLAARAAPGVPAGTATSEFRANARNPEAVFADWCDQQGYSSDGEIDEALRGAFYEGIRFCCVDVNDDQVPGVPAPVAPWGDYLCQPIHHGDRLMHPADGAEFTAFRLAGPKLAEPTQTGGAA